MQENLDTLSGSILGVKYSHLYCTTYINMGLDLGEGQFFQTSRGGGIEEKNAFFTFKIAF